MPDVKVIYGGRTSNFIRTDEQKRMQTINSSFKIKEEVICRINPADSDLIARLILKIVAYLLDFIQALMEQ